MKKLFVIFALLWGIAAQAQLTFTAPVSYWTGVPTGAPSQKGSRIAVNLTTNRLYQWDSANTEWDLLPYGIDEVIGCAAPAYTPDIGDSPFAINRCSIPELYSYFSGSWHLVGGGGGTTYTAGTGINITGTVISNTGLLTGTTFGGDMSGVYSNLQLGAGVVGTNEIATDAVTAAKIAAGAVGSSELASTTVTPGSYTSTNLTVDADGRITAASNGTAGLTSVTTDGSLAGSGTGGSPLGIAFPILAPNGSSTELPYSFAAQPLAGMFFDETSLVVTSGADIPILVGTANTLGTSRAAEFSTGNGPDESGALFVETGDAEGGKSGPLNIRTGAGKNESGLIGIDTGDSALGNTGGITITTGNSTGFTSGGVAITTGTGDVAGDIDITAGNSAVGLGPHVYIFSGEGPTGGGEFKLAAGGSTAGAGGLFNLQAGDSEDADGGGFVMEAGSSTNGAGGGFTASAGSGVFGGLFLLSGGDATADDSEAGSLYIQGGNHIGTLGSGGVVRIVGGTAQNSGSSGGLLELRGGEVTSGAVGGDAIISGGFSIGNPALNGKVIVQGNGLVNTSLTTTQRDALTGVTAGTTIFCSNATANDSSTGVIQTYNGTTWKNHW